MGMWGPGPFENDAAADFLADLAQDDAPVEAVVAALTRISEAGRDEYLDVDDGQICVAACELVALAFGPDGVPRRLAVLVDELAEKPALVKQALQALPRVLDRKRSELAGLWESNEPFDALYERLLAAQQDGADVPRIDLAALLADAPDETDSPRPPAQPYGTGPFDARSLLNTPAVRASTAASAKSWHLVTNGVLNIYDQLGPEDLALLEGRRLSQLQFARRFKVNDATLRCVDALLAKHPKAPLWLTLNGYGAFDDLDVVSRLLHLRELIVSGSPAFLTETAKSVLARFPQLTRAVVEGIEAKRAS